MKGGNERRAFAARGDVARPEVGDDVDSGKFGDPGRVVELEREAALGAVADGLTVKTDGRDFLPPDACFLKRFFDDGGIEIGERH